MILAERVLKRGWPCCARLGGDVRVAPRGVFHFGAGVDYLSETRKTDRPCDHGRPVRWHSLQVTVAFANLTLQWWTHVGRNGGGT